MAALFDVYIGEIYQIFTEEVKRSLLAIEVRNYTLM